MTTIEVINALDGFGKLGKAEKTKFVEDYETCITAAFLDGATDGKECKQIKDFIEFWTHYFDKKLLYTLLFSSPKKIYALIELSSE